jgi:hypothetical protein
MAEIINLNKARKAKAKAGADTEAAANRVRFGRSKAARIEAASEQTLATRRVDGHRLEPVKPEKDDAPPGKA